MHRLPWFIGGSGDCVASLEVLEEPGHVAPKRAHRLHALCVAFALALFASERHVPVLRRDDGAIGFITVCTERLMLLNFGPLLIANYWNFAASFSLLFSQPN